MNSHAENEVEKAVVPPPDPGELAALDQQIAQVEEAIAEIEKGRHASVSEASERCVAAELRGRNIEQELKKVEGRIPFDLRQSIQEEAGLGRGEDAESLGRQFPQVAVELLIRYLRAMREMRAAVKERQAARLHLDQAIAAEITPRQHQLNELGRARRAAQHRFDDASWRYTEAQDTEQACRKYLDTFASGAHVAEARLQLEDIWWREARDQRSEEAIRQYLRQCWEGAHANEARKLFDELRDERAWAAARKTNDAEGYGLYLKDWPNGRHAAEARRLQPLRLAARRRWQQWLGIAVLVLAAILIPAGWNNFSRARLDEVTDSLQHPRPEEFDELEATLKAASIAPWHHAQAEKLKAELQSLRQALSPTNAVGTNDAKTLLDQQLIKPDGFVPPPPATNR